MFSTKDTGSEKIIFLYSAGLTTIVYFANISFTFTYTRETPGAAFPKGVSAVTPQVLRGFVGEFA